MLKLVDREVSVEDMHRFFNTDLFSDMIHFIVDNVMSCESLDSYTVKASIFRSHLLVELHSMGFDITSVNHILSHELVRSVDEHNTLSYELDRLYYMRVGRIESIEQLEKYIIKVNS